MLQGAQFRILRVFIDGDRQNFAELCKQAGYPTDLGGYYIRQLLSQGYLEKGARGEYVITPKGKQQFPFGAKGYQARPRLNILIVAKQGDAYLLIRRDVQPFIGTHEWPASAVQLGEPLAEAAKRIMSIRLLTEDVTPEFIGFFRRIDMYDDTIFDDKLFAMHTCTLAADAAFEGRPESGEIVRCTEAELQQLKRPAKSLLDILRVTQSDSASFTEKIYQLTQTDLSASE